MSDRVQHFSGRPGVLDQARRLQNLQVLDHRLPGHRQAIGEGRRAGPAGVGEDIQEPASRRVGQGGKDDPDDPDLVDGPARPGLGTLDRPRGLIGGHSLVRSASRLAKPSCCSQPSDGRFVSAAM